jgi:uncharacterized protein YbaR (Trm112 family)
VFTELIDMLRCPVSHEVSWLVASSTRTADRHILAGRLGCPVCRTSFEIVDGEVRFGPAGTLLSTRTLDQDAAFRLAAQLHLVEAPQPILLLGNWSRAVAPLRALVPTVTMFAGNATSVVALDDRVSTLRLPPDVIPLATASLRAVALDPAHGGAQWLAESARVLRTAGRLVAPPTTSLEPSLWRTLAVDADTLVAERLPAASAPVSLKRAPTQPLFSA